MFVAVNRIAAPPQAIDRMIAAFHQNAASLKEFEGFIAFELWRGDATLDAVSKWDSRAAYESWRNSDNFLAAHAGARGGQSSQGGGSSIAYYEGDVVVER